MKADVFYSTAPGRFLFKVLRKAGVFVLVSRFLRTKASRHLIPGYIRKYGIDMKPFDGQNYTSFAEFFTRKRSDTHHVIDSDALISPCDGLLSIYGATEYLTIPMKGSTYTLTDLVPDREVAEIFQNGLCLVFRLEASDYHHFCCFDDGLLVETNHIPGQLHSVQPIAQYHVPVYRLNRRWWSVLETKHFGTAVQIEVGAMLVGGVSFSMESGWFNRGEELGCFELTGSTIVLLLRSDVRNRLVLNTSIIPAIDGKTEVRVQMGSAIGVLTDEKTASIIYNRRRLR